jgi:integrase
LLLAAAAGQQKRRHVRATTAYRHAWFIERYVNPAVGDVPLRRLRADHLDGLYESLAATGARGGDGLAPKTILEAHMIMRAALDLAVERELVVRNVAHGARARRRPPTRAAAQAWNAEELRAFLTAARQHRLYAVLHLAAHTGMPRGELVGLKWSDLDRSTWRPVDLTDASERRRPTRRVRRQDAQQPLYRRSR